MKNELRTSQGEGYILEQGEIEIARFKQSWIVFAKEILIIGIALIWLILLLEGFSKHSFFDWLQFVLIFFVVWFEISSIRRKSWFSLTLTNKRIIYQGADMHPFSGYIYYRLIDKIVDTSFLYEKLFRTGRVYIKSIGTEHTFKKLKEKDKFIQIVQEQVSMANNS